MTDFFDIAATPSVLDLQRRKGSLGLYVADPGLGPGDPHQLTEPEIELITTRDSFYLATVSQTGWPYVQHRGGASGFVKVLDEHTIGWVERTGNRQYVGTGNIADNGRIAAIFVDYPSRTRLKVYGRATHHPDPTDELLTALDGAGVRQDGAVTVELLATSWNCPKYITPRFTETEVRALTARQQARIDALEAELAELRLAATSPHA